MYEWLQKAYTMKDAQDFIFLAKDPVFKPFRHDARFKELVAKIQLPE